VYDAQPFLVAQLGFDCEPTGYTSDAHCTGENLRASVCLCSIPIAVVRPCAIYGPRDTHTVMAESFYSVGSKDGKITLFGDGEERRHHIYVWDVARIVEKLCLYIEASGLLTPQLESRGLFYAVAELVIAIIGRESCWNTYPDRVRSTHRHFDTAALGKAYLDFSYSALDGLASNIG